MVEKSQPEGLPNNLDKETVDKMIEAEREKQL